MPRSCTLCRACCVTIDAEKLRLFIALWPGEGVRQAVHAVSRPAIEASGGRPVPRANYHLTLVFLGDQPRSHLPRIRQALASVDPPAGVMHLARFGTFAKARVLWLGPGWTPLELAGCVRDLRTALRAAGVRWRRGPERFRAHVTLARRIRAAPDMVPRVPVTWHYAGLSLLVSERAQARYRVLESRRRPGPGGMK